MGRLLPLGGAWDPPIDLALPLPAPRSTATARFTEEPRPLKSSVMDRKERQHPFYDFYKIKVYINVDGWMDRLCLFG